VKANILEVDHVNYVKGSFKKLVVNESCKELQLLVAKLEALQGELVVARSVSEQQRMQTILGEESFEKIEVKSLRLQGFIRDAKNDLGLLEVEEKVV
jgi:hypothetical protein